MKPQILVTLIKKTHFALFDMVVFRLKMFVRNSFTTYQKLSRDVPTLGAILCKYSDYIFVAIIIILLRV